MKRYFFFVMSFAFLLASCGGGGDTEATDGADSTQTELPRSLQNATTTVDLSDNYVNASIIIPDETQGPVSISANDFGETHVQVGDVYHVVFAEQIEGDLASYIGNLQEDLMYANEIVDQGEDYVLYKSTITGSSVDPEFHFFAIKTIDGVTFESARL